MYPTANRGQVSATLLPFSLFFLEDCSFTVNWLTYHKMEWPGIFFKWFFYIIPNVLLILGRVACSLLHEVFAHLQKCIPFLLLDLARPSKSCNVALPEAACRGRLCERWAGWGWPCSSLCSLQSGFGVPGAWNSDVPGKKCLRLRS